MDSTLQSSPTPLKGPPHTGQASHGPHTHLDEFLTGRAHIRLGLPVVQFPKDQVSPRVLHVLPPWGRGC